MMGRLTSTAVTIATLVAGAPAAAPQTTGGPDPAIVVSSSLEQFFGRAPVDQTAVVDRILSLDVDGDDRVSSDELPERMQRLMNRGDQNHDGFLESEEIRGLVDTRPFRLGNFAISRDTAGMTGVIDDLKLPPPTRERALALAKSYRVPRNVNDPASIDGGDLYARLRELLDDEEYANFVAAAARLARTPQVRIRGIVGAIP
jgi:hypothetical protein